MSKSCSLAYGRKSKGNLVFVLLRDIISDLCHGSIPVLSLTFQIFGLLKGQRLAILVDTSDANCSYERLDIFQQSLQVIIISDMVQFEI